MTKVAGSISRPTPNEESDDFVKFYLQDVRLCPETTLTLTNVSEYHTIFSESCVRLFLTCILVK